MHISGLGLGRDSCMAKQRRYGQDACDWPQRTLKCSKMGSLVPFLQRTADQLPFLPVCGQWPAMHEWFLDRMRSRSVPMQRRGEIVM